MEKYSIIFNCIILVYLFGLWSSKGWKNKLFKIILLVDLICNIIVVLNNFGFIVKI